MVRRAGGLLQGHRLLTQGDRPSGVGRRRAVDAAHRQCGGSRTPPAVDDGVVVDQLFTEVEPVDDPIRVTADLRRVRHEQRQLWRDRRLGQSLAVSQESGRPTMIEEPGLMILEKGGRSRLVAGELEVADRFVDAAVLGEPIGRPAEHRAGHGRIRRTRSALEGVAEQAVAAIPVTITIQSGDEEVVPLELGQHSRRALQAEGGVAQRARQQLEGRGADQQVALVGHEARQHLAGEVVEQVSVVAAHPGRCSAGVRTAAQRQPGQLEPGRPALGPLPQRGGRGGIERASAHGREHGRGLVAERTGDRWPATRRARPCARIRASGSGGSQRLAITS